MSWARKRPRTLRGDEDYLEDHSEPESDDIPEVAEPESDDIPEVAETFTPRMNVYEHKSSTNMVTATFELPGVKPQDVTVNFLNNELTISGNSVDPQPQGEGKYTSRELPYGKFSRVLKVPLGLRPQDFKARMENGLLILTLPKDPPKQVPHRIPIE